MKIEISFPVGRVFREKDIRDGRQGSIERGTAASYTPGAYLLQMGNAVRSRK